MSQEQTTTAPAPQSPAPEMYYPQQVSQPVHKAKAKWLTFEYILAMFSAVSSALLFTDVIVKLFGVWMKIGGGQVAAATSVGGWFDAVLPIRMVTPGTGIVLGAVLAVLFAGIAFVAFGRVSRTVVDRPGYTSRLAYKVPTYAAFIALLIPALVLVAKLITILISSLLFIGVNSAGEVYKSLYLGEFLPYLMGLGVIGATLWMFKDVISGRNSTKLLSYILMGAAALVLVSGAITVAVQAHDNKTMTSGGSTTVDYNGGVDATTTQNAKKSLCDKYGVGCS